MNFTIDTNDDRYNDRSYWAQKFPELKADRDRLAAEVAKLKTLLHNSGNNYDELYERYGLLFDAKANLAAELADLKTAKGDAVQMAAIVWIYDEEGDCATKSLSALVWWKKNTSGLWQWEVWDDSNADSERIASGEVASKELAKRAAESALRELTQPTAPAATTMEPTVYQTPWKQAEQQISYLTTQLAERDATIAELTPLADNLKWAENNCDEIGIYATNDGDGNTVYCEYEGKMYGGKSIATAIAAALAGK